MVYVVRPGDDNEPLRYSLRSMAANVPHRRVWVAGHAPPWLRGVGHIPTAQRGDKHANSTGNLRAACEHPDVAEEFLYVNDDFYCLRPVTEVPVYHRGRVADVYTQTRHMSTGQWLPGLVGTRRLLARLGHPDPLCYELHVPMPVTKTGVLETLDVGAGVRALHKRTLYGALHQVGGTRMRDPKVTHPRPIQPSGDWLSTSQRALVGGAGRFLRGLFPTPCRYEQEGA